MKRRDFLKGLIGASTTVAITSSVPKHGGEWIRIDCKDSGAHILGVILQWETGQRPPMTMMEIHVEGDEDKENEYHWVCREGKNWWSRYEELWFSIMCTKSPINHVIRLRLHERLGDVNNLDDIAFEQVPRDKFKVLVRKIPQSELLGWIRKWEDIFKFESTFPFEELEL